MLKKLTRRSLGPADSACKVTLWTVQPGIGHHNFEDKILE